ncbi:MAG: winged helix-turn-helix transcriptional regulator [Erysipelotrichaceae bacterium]|nr:winged helix-turn-helix transcriptional regulator [Erysipelotrichaceae bacterium]
MTKREHDILQLIQENPTIDQSEIADLLHIKRSTVAVHIANLTKKGVIKGKGYILGEPEESYILGIGAANVDINCHTKYAINLRDSNPGYLQYSFGGVTHNVCMNAALLGADVKFISAIGDDENGEGLIKEAMEAGMDLSHVLRVKNHPSSTYISFADDKGDMFVAFSDMRVMENMTVEFIRKNASVLKRAKLITIDPSIPVPVIEELVNVYAKEVPLYVDPVSIAYARVIKPYLGAFQMCKPNVYELEVLSDMKIETDEDLQKACRQVLSTGLKEIVVSLGRDGCFYMNRDGLTIRRALQPLDTVANATGAGDAFMAAWIYGQVNDWDYDTRIDYALAAGAAALTSETTVNKEMSLNLLDNMIKERKK